MPPQPVRNEAKNARSRGCTPPREAIVARIELQYGYEELALALGKPTANAARVALKRAVARLLEEMNRNA